MFAVAAIPHDVLARFEQRYAGQPQSVLDFLHAEFVAYITTQPSDPVPPGDWTNLEKAANDHVDTLYRTGIPGF